MVRTIPPSFVEIGPKLRVVALLTRQWPKTAKNRGEPQKMTPSSETEIFFGVVQMGKLVPWVYWWYVSLTKIVITIQKIDFLPQISKFLGQKCQYKAQNANLGPNLTIFGPKSIHWGEGVKLLVQPHIRESMRHLSFVLKTLTSALCSKSNGSYDIKDFGTLSLIFSTSKYFRRKCQPCPSFFSHPNIPDKWKRAQLSLDQMKKKERVKVKS